jgi:U3 small nucleolar RNA-associated protein 3
LLIQATTPIFYLRLRSTPKYAAHPDLVESHPVPERLLTLDQPLATLEDLELEGEGEGDEEIFDLFNHMKGGKKKPRLEPNEL